jgi:hypothetical protein
VAHDLTVLSVVFVLGLAMLAYELASVSKSLRSSLIRIVGGSAIALLSGATLIRIEPAIRAFKPGIIGDIAPAIVAWAPAALVGACTLKYRLGPRGLPGRIALSGVSALFVGLLLSEVRNLLEVEGLLAWFVIPIVVLLFPGTYQPTSRWGIWIRRTALSSLAVSMGSVFVLSRSASGQINGSYAWGVNLGLGHWVYMHYPYGYYANRASIYLGIISLLLTVMCSLACLCIWLIDTFSRKPAILSEAKNLH